MSWTSTTASTPPGADRAWKPPTAADPCGSPWTPNLQRWPEFVEAARRRGVRASLSLPLIVESADTAPELVGSVNVYSYTATAFDPYDEHLMTLFTTAAGQAVSNARRWQLTRTTVDQLEQALTSRSDIDQAKGALRAVHGYTADDAFAALVEQSQHRNVKLHTIAREFLHTLDAPLPTHPTPPTGQHHRRDCPWNRPTTSSALDGPR